MPFRRVVPRRGHTGIAADYFVLLEGSLDIEDLHLQIPNQIPTDTTQTKVARK